MAFTKSIATENGVTLTYHKIGYVNFFGGTVRGRIFSYESAEDRLTSRPFMGKSFTVKITVEEEESMGIRALCYKKLKELPEWADAEDC